MRAFRICSNSAFLNPSSVGCRRESAERDSRDISNLGTINQRITLWEDHKTLMFEMIDTDMNFGKYVTSIKERFDLAATGERKTRITRTTDFKVKGWLSLFKSMMIWVGLKNVHRYVFRNWGEAQVNRASEYQFAETEHRR